MTAAGLGVVVIGRNEGERLVRCLRSLEGRADHIVYVDSGSTDGSREFARSAGVNVLDLDLSRPFTMPRARNEGFARLMELEPDLAFVQFVDGDCEVVSGWLEAARAAIEGEPGIAVVCGQRRERHPEASVYNLLCDMEWERPSGRVKACGGDAMMRVDAFRRVGGFNPSLIAGEEAELCFRLRQEGHGILSLPDDMTIHDAAIHRFGQWWKRCIRSGHAYAEGAFLHGRSPERFQVGPVRSALFFGLFLPLLILVSVGLAFVTPLALAGAAIGMAFAGFQWARIRAGRRRVRPDHAGVYATFVLLSKIPQALGVLTFEIHRRTGRRSALIEYK